jgi:long-chain acyl-CoA synthetase
LKKTIFDAGLAAKTQGLKHGHLKHGLYDRLLFNKIKKALGMDQLRIMVSGSAPLSQNVMIFFRCMLGVPVIEGYGQTEGSGCTSLAPPDDMATIGHVGGPHAGAEIVLMNVPEMGYVSTDTDYRGQACFGCGEICVRGPGIFKGYYKDEEKTRETIDEEGWLHSGDIGLWRPDGTLQIIDRKKNIFKLSQGEYVAPEKIENVLQGSPLIAQCFVYGDSFQSVLVAVIVPDEEPVRIWAATHDASLAKEPFEQICKHPILKKTILSDIRAFSEQNKLNGFETVKAIYVDSSPFSLENDLMTPTFKLKRQKARDHYEAEIAKMYAGLPAPFSKL